MLNLGSSFHRPVASSNPERVLHQRQRLTRLTEVLARKQDSLARTEANQEKLKRMLANAKTEEHRQRVSEWMRDGEGKRVALAIDIDDIEGKINDISAWLSLR